MDLINIADEGLVPLSEVGFEGQRPEENNDDSVVVQPTSNILQNMEILLPRLLATAQPQTSNFNATKRLIRFDLDDADADIEGHVVSSCPDRKGGSGIVAASVKEVNLRTQIDKEYHDHVIWITMGFKRVWDSSCPRVWDKWEDNGTTWVIRDLPPEDDEEALKILVENLCPDEILCCLSNLIDEPLSVQSIVEFWRGHLSQRMSLACYAEKDGKSKLVALNVCLVICEGEKADDVIEGESWKNVYGALKLAEEKVDAFKYFGMEKLLYTLGLVVRRDYRGAKLGSRILAARKPLSLHHGIKATYTVFSGPASQISAARAGFTTIATITLKELAESGLNYPEDETRALKVMVKKFE